eukprot:TRINITY_DN27753_c0_g1_i1.p1 TRINITY_DN27753_c0_g1~~TRINITY_DN27753_c0_g1_i1.p1  ORF type:complete len:385 (+),score=66.15 TRINITY_DN27753_c0_g1_i1:92-1246(+)
MDEDDAREVAATKFQAGGQEVLEKARSTPRPGTSGLSPPSTRSKRGYKTLVTAALNMISDEDPMLEDLQPDQQEHTKIPPLVLKLTTYHGTKVPVVMLFFLSNGDVERLCFCDKFWRRICRRPSMHRALFCRDFHRDGMSTSRPCVWQTLQGRAAGLERCLLHRYEALPADFAAECMGITRIPGRSSEELMESYSRWRQARRAVGIEAPKEEELQEEVKEVQRPSWLSRTEGMPRRLVKILTRNYQGETTDSLEETPLPWSTAAHCKYALSARHGRGAATFDWTPVRSKAIVTTLPHTAGARSPNSAASSGTSWATSPQTTASTGVSWQTSSRTAASGDSNCGGSSMASTAGSGKPWAKGGKAAGSSRSRGGFRGAANMALTAR